MQTVKLVSHPAFVPSSVQKVTARWQRVEDGRIVMLRYRVDGCQELVVPKRAKPGRADNLWQHTCFELFLSNEAGRYAEFNFSPSGKWAAWDFVGYRSGRLNLEPLALPKIIIDSGPSVFTLTAFIHAGELLGVKHAMLSAVVEEEAGRMSYWAPRHAGLQPDFHNPACFVLPVP